MSFYLMNNHSSLRNILKIGYMSTTNIKHIISRYATGCGNNITVFQFLDHDPKHMETLFKKQFEPQNVELEFFDSAHFFQYLEWCMDYTKSAPITGYGKLKCVSKVDRKSVSTQCEPQQTCTEQTCTPASCTEQTCTEQTCTPQSCIEQTFTEQSELVISKLESVTSALNDMFGKKQEDVKFVILPNNKVKMQFMRESVT